MKKLLSLALALLLLAVMLPVTAMADTYTLSCRRDCGIVPQRSRL